MKVCTKCNTEKPENGFYTRANGKLYAHCKDCHRKRTARNTRNRQRKPPTLKPTETAEQIVLRKLARVGVPCLHIPSWCDLIAFGIVQIEVKQVYYKYPSHVIQFSYVQRRDGLHADIIAVLWQDTLYFLPPNHEKLFNDDGLLKTGVTINVSGHIRTGTPLVPDDLWTMNEGLFEIRRIMGDKINLLKQGASIDSLLARVPSEYIGVKAS